MDRSASGGRPGRSPAARVPLRSDCRCARGRCHPGSFGTQRRIAAQRQMNALGLHLRRVPGTRPERQRALFLVPGEPAGQISPDRCRAAQKAHRLSKSRSVAKTTSPFELHGVCRPGGWLDGGGQRHRCSNAAFPPQRQFEAVSPVQRQSEPAPRNRSKARPQPDSLGSLASTSGAPIRTGGASPLRVATGGDASFEASEAVAAARPACANLRRGNLSGLVPRTVARWAPTQWPNLRIKAWLNSDTFL
jgi:hypothetical protein